MAKIGLLFIGLLSLLFLVNTCSAVGFQVSPDVKYANPGDTVTYGLTVNLTADELLSGLLPFTEKFSIYNPITNWVYSFSNESVILDTSSQSNYSVLSITVPLNAIPGEYTHRVNATCYNPYLGASIPDQIEIHVVNTNVQQVPEFPSIALPVAAILGLVAIFGRKKEI